MIGFCRWLHRVRSDSRRGFGIHSPFVFDFLTSVLLEKNCYYAYPAIDVIASSRRESKMLRFFYRIINYYNCKKILFLGSYAPADNLSHVISDDIKCRYSANIDTLYEEKFDIIFCDNDFARQIEWRRIENKTICVVKNICQTDRFSAPKSCVDVFMDFFDFAIMFVNHNVLHQAYKFYL